MPNLHKKNWMESNLDDNPGIKPAVVAGKSFRTIEQTFEKSLYIVSRVVRYL